MVHSFTPTIRGPRHLKTVMQGKTVKRGRFVCAAFDFFFTITEFGSIVGYSPYPSNHNIALLISFCAGASRFSIRWDQPFIAFCRDKIGVCARHSSEITSIVIQLIFLLRILAIRAPRLASFSLVLGPRIIDSHSTAA